LPDFNRIEMALSKLKALLRKHAARSFDTICGALRTSSLYSIQCGTSSKPQDMVPLKRDTL